MVDTAEMAAIVAGVAGAVSATSGIRDLIKKLLRSKANSTSQPILRDASVQAQSGDGTRAPVSPS